VSDGDQREKPRCVCMACRSCVMGLVVYRLYFGRRPSPPEMAQNASVVKRLATKHDWARLARVVEGLALRRDRGELGKIGPQDPVCLTWLIDKEHRMNQLAICEDAYYAKQPKKNSGLMGEIMARMAQEGK
jgi:hypothetical protein